MQETKSLSVIDGKSLLALDVEPPRFIVDRLIPMGLHILSGSAKIGKSCQSFCSGFTLPPRIRFISIHRP